MADAKSSYNSDSDQIISTNTNLDEPTTEVDVKPRRGRRKRAHETSTKLKEYHNHINDVSDSSKRIEIPSNTNMTTGNPKRRKNRYTNSFGRRSKT